MERTDERGLRIGDRYELVRSIGAGAMGTVYAALRLEDGAPVAIKLIHPELSKNEISAARFEREARLTQTIDHPGIVRTLDAGAHRDGRLFLVMELLEGESFQARLDAGCGYEQGVAVIREALDALAAAHRARVVHRDLKPENVFLAKQGGRVRVKLLDFGIAREIGGASSVTRTATMMGTPNYMSPELVLNAKAAGPASDVWAIGVMLYQVMTGALPFASATAYEVVLAVCRSPHLPILARNPGADPRLAAAAERCLSKDPGTRPADAAALLALLGPR